MKLLFILDYDTFKGGLLEVAERASPYSDMIWLRIKNKPKSTVLTKAKMLRELLPHKTLILSENAGMANFVRFDGVHLNKRSTITPQEVKRLYPHLITGYSAHSPNECAIEADYKTLSPIFSSRKAIVPLGAVSCLYKNVYALGGVNTSNLAQLSGKGYHGIAGITFYEEIRELYRRVINFI